MWTKKIALQKLTNQAKSLSQQFSVAEATQAVKSKFQDFVSFVKTEASKAMKPPTSFPSSFHSTTTTMGSGAPSSPLFPPSLTPIPSDSNTSTSTGPSISLSTQRDTNERNDASQISDPSSRAFAEFLEKMNDRRAYPLVKYYRSFVRDFTKRSWTISEQIRILHDFLTFMQSQWTKNELFMNCTSEELEQAQEGLEKLLMHRLFSYIYSPKTSDDGVQDELLCHKVILFDWIELKHLDVELDMELALPYIKAAKRELLLMDNYRSPAEKLKCIMNSCTHIFDLLKHTDQSQGADALLPLLIFVIIKARPLQLVSNIQFIQRFRDPKQLQGEAGYYLTHMLGSVKFLQTLEASSLSISKEEFDERLNLKMKQLELSSDPNDLFQLDLALATQASLANPTLSTTEPLPNSTSNPVTLVQGRSATNINTNGMQEISPLSPSLLLTTEPVITDASSIQSTHPSTSPPIPPNLTSNPSSTSSSSTLLISLESPSLSTSAPLPTPSLPSSSSSSSSSYSTTTSSSSSSSLPSSSTSFPSQPSNSLLD